MKKNQSGELVEADCCRQIGRHKRIIFRRIVLCLHRGLRRCGCQTQNVTFWFECMAVQNQHTPVSHRIRSTAKTLLQWSVASKNPEMKTQNDTLWKLHACASLLQGSVSNTSVNLSPERRRVVLEAYVFLLLRLSVDRPEVDYFVAMGRAGYVCVAIIHRTLIWTTGPLTCAQMLMHAIAHGVVRTPKESLHWKLTLGRRSLAAPGNRTCVSFPLWYFHWSPPFNVSAKCTFGQCVFPAVKRWARLICQSL